MQSNDVASTDKIVPAFEVHNLWFLHLVVRTGSAHSLHVDAQQEVAYVFRRLSGMIAVPGVHLVWIQTTT